MFILFYETKGLFFQQHGAHQLFKILLLLHSQLSVISCLVWTLSLASNIIPLIAKRCLREWKALMGCFFFYKGHLALWFMVMLLLGYWSVIFSYSRSVYFSLNWRTVHLFCSIPHLSSFPAKVNYVGILLKCLINYPLMLILKSY